jgi:hypothetical protein
MKYNKLRNLALTILLNVMMGLLSLLPNCVYAQMKPSTTSVRYGLELSAGVKSFRLSSNLISLNEIPVDQRGGGIGVTLEHDRWKAKIRPLGFYHSNSNTRTSVNLIESGLEANFYPLRVGSGRSTRVPRPYFTGGLMRGNFKVNGAYLAEGQTSSCIYDSETFSGSIVSWTMMGGAGVEYQIRRGHEFITIFAEIKKGLSAGSKADQNLLRNTVLKSLTALNIGFAISINQ